MKNPRPTDEELARLGTKRALDALSQRQRRRRLKQEAERKRLLAAVPDPPADQAGALESWAADRLIVPAGHPAAGQPMKLPDFAVAWFAAALGAREALLCLARKNAKSAVLAIFLLSRLVGPLRTSGFRGAVLSVTAAKAVELRMQMEAIARASALEGLTFRSTPPPGLVLGPSGQVDILSATAVAGHASGFDDVIVDEIGLLGERHRPMIMGVRSSGSARPGSRFLAISIQGDGPFIPELIQRRDMSGTVVHAHIPADPSPPVDDEDAWAEGNPGLGTIKSRQYMRAESARVKVTPVDAPLFRAHDLNCLQTPCAEPLCEVDTWRACEAEPADLPPRTGRCVIGLDAGEPESMAVAVAWWPSGRVEVWAGVREHPTLEARGQSAGVGDLFRRMADRGELRTTSSLAEFLAGVRGELAGEAVVLAAADAHRQREILAAAGGGWRWRWLPHQGGPDWALGIRVAATAAATRRLRIAPSLLMRSALAATALQRDGTGQPSLTAVRERQQIGAVRALCLAAFADTGRPTGATLAF